MKGTDPCCERAPRGSAAKSDESLWRHGASGALSEKSRTTDRAQGDALRHRDRAFAQGRRAARDALEGRGNVTLDVSTVGRNRGTRSRRRLPAARGVQLRDGVDQGHQPGRDAAQDEGDALGSSCPPASRRPQGSPEDRLLRARARASRSAAASRTTRISTSRRLCFASAAPVTWISATPASTTSPRLRLLPRARRGRVARAWTTAAGSDRSGPG